MDLDPRHAAIGAARGCRLGDDWRVGRRELTGVTVGDAPERDHGPVMAAEPAPPGYRVTVSIVDVGRWLTPGSAIVKYAEQVGEATEGIDWMLPPRVQRLLRLRGDGPRPAVSIVADLNAYGEITDVDVVRSAVARRHFSDAEVDQFLAGQGDPPLVAHFQLLEDVARLRLQARRVAGAPAFFELEAGLLTGRDGQLVSPASVGQLIVSELQILAGEALARYMGMRAVDGLFLTCPPPSLDAVDFAEIVDHGDVRELAPEVNAGGPAVYSTQPGAHGLLGLDAIAPCGAVITEWAHAVNLAQVAALLEGHEPLYTQPDLERVAARLNDLSRTRRLSAGSRDDRALAALEDDGPDALRELSNSAFEDVVAFAAAYGELRPGLTSVLRERLAAGQLSSAAMAELLLGGDAEPSLHEFRVELMAHLARHRPDARSALKIGHDRGMITEVQIETAPERQGVRVTASTSRDDDVFSLEIVTVARARAKAREVAAVRLLAQAAGVPAPSGLRVPELPDPLDELSRLFKGRQIRFDTRLVEGGAESRVWRSLLQIQGVGTFVGCGATEADAETTVALRPPRTPVGATRLGTTYDVSVLQILSIRADRLHLPKPEYQEVAREQDGKAGVLFVVRVARDAHVTETIEGPWTEGRDAHWARLRVAALALDLLEPGWWDNPHGVNPLARRQRSQPQLGMDHETRMRFLSRAAYGALFAYLSLQSRHDQPLHRWEQMTAWAANPNPVLAHASSVAKRIAEDQRIGAKARKLGLAPTPWAGERLGERQRPALLHERVGDHPRGNEWRAILDEALSYADDEVIAITARLLTMLELPDTDDRIGGHMEWLEDLLLPLIWLSDDPIPVLEQPRDDGERRLVVMLGDAAAFAMVADAYRDAGVPVEVGEPGASAASRELLRAAAETGDALLVLPGAPASEDTIDAVADQANDGGLSRLVVLHDKRGVLELGAMALTFDRSVTGWVVTPADWERRTDRLLVVPRARTRAAVDVGLVRGGCLSLQGLSRRRHA
jgi:hypothetical protein